MTINLIEIQPHTYYHLRRYACKQTPTTYIVDKSGIPVFYCMRDGKFYAGIMPVLKVIANE